jgi:cytochrome c
MNLWGWIIGAVFVVALGLFGWQVLSTDPAQFASSGGMVPEDTTSIEDGAPLADVKLPAELSANAKIGKNIFEAKCSVCHGENAAGQNGIAPPLVNQIYEPGHHGDGAFVSAAMNGVTSHHWNFGNMPKIEGLTAGDVRLIATYVRELQRENGIY